MKSASIVEKPLSRLSALPVSNQVKLKRLRNIIIIPATELIMALHDPVAKPMNSMHGRGSVIKSDNRSRSTWWATNISGNTPEELEASNRAIKRALKRKMGKAAA